MHGIVVVATLPFMAEILQGNTWTAWVKDPNFISKQ
jgi:hypothetical protein